VFFRKSREEERKCHARLTREYTDGGANICAGSTQFSSAKNLFFADENEIRFSGRLSVLPCCIQREADEITALLIAVFAVNFSTSFEEPNNETLFSQFMRLDAWGNYGRIKT